MMASTPGQVVRAVGELTNDRKFDEQCRMIRYSTLVPATVSAVEKYLGSGLIKGIGPVTAKRTVKAFGNSGLLSANDAGVSLYLSKLVIFHGKSPYPVHGNRREEKSDDGYNCEILMTNQKFRILYWNFFIEGFGTK